MEKKVHFWLGGLDFVFGGGLEVVFEVKGLEETEEKVFLTFETRTVDQLGENLKKFKYGGVYRYQVVFDGFSGLFLEEVRNDLADLR